MILIKDCENEYCLNVNVDFNIQQYPTLKKALEDIEGVEEVPTFGAYKYSVLLEIGEVFDQKELRLKIESVIVDFISKKKK